MHHDRIAEIQGPYGPLSISEYAVQRAWALLDFPVLRFRSMEGRPVRILRPGRWNNTAGPDFLDAEVTIEAAARHGHVEVHLYEEDWFRHGHDTDPAYEDTILHAVVFGPDPHGRRARTASGRAVETIVLGPWLPCDLETFAGEHERDGGDEAALQLLAVEAARAPEERMEAMLGRARERWNRRLHFARYRLAHHDGEPIGALHGLFLEILGYRRNATAMLLLSHRFPLDQMRASGWDAAHYLKAIHGWRRHGIRPANQPATRLDQYLRFIRRHPGWPASSLEWMPHLQAAAGTVAGCLHSTRRPPALGPLRRRLHRDLLGGIWSGTRAELLLTDGLFPLLSALSGHDLFPLWHLWWPGDAPDPVLRLLDLQLQAFPAGQRPPRSHGLLQSALQIFLQDAVGGHKLLQLTPSAPV